MSSVVKVFFQAVAFGIEDNGYIKGLEAYPVNKTTDFLRSIGTKKFEKAFDYDSNMHFHDVNTSELPIAKFVRSQEQGRYSNATIIEYQGQYYLSPISYHRTVDVLATCNGVAANLRPK